MTSANEAKPSGEMNADEPEAKRPKPSETKASKTKEPAKRFEQTEIARNVAPGAKTTRDGRETFKAISWNVAGLRSFVEKSGAKLRALVEEERPDVIILQEHKLQMSHIDAFGSKLKELCPGYDTTRFAVSTAKKGYSGIVAVSREGRKGGQVTIEAMLGGASKPAASDGFKAVSHSEGLQGGTAYVDEGRTLTIEYEKFYVVSAYVPNSGQDLKRLDYRIKEWERDMKAHLKALDAKKPVIYIGDLNVAHLDADIWNVTASHIKKSAGTTPQERGAFGVMLEENGLHDSFRFFHGDAAGWFSYWSVRAGNRPFNKGLRLDYAVASKRLFDGGDGGVEVVDAFILDQVTGSDHAPVGITLAIKD